MAKQSGLIFIEGTMNNMTFFKTRDGVMLVKRKSCISKERLKNDPAFERLRRNNMEFSHAGKAAKLLRHSVRHVSNTISDGKIVSRLMKLMLAVVETDEINTHGSRNVGFGNLHYLKGFNFNERAALTSVFTVDFEHTVDRDMGQLKVRINSFNPWSMVRPAAATHFKIISVAAEIDFSNDHFKNAGYESDALPLNNATTVEIKIVHQLTVKSKLPIFLLLGVRYFIENGSNYDPVAGSDFNALRIVAVSTV